MHKKFKDALSCCFWGMMSCDFCHVNVNALVEGKIYIQETNGFFPWNITVKFQSSILNGPSILIFRRQLQASSGIIIMGCGPHLVNGVIPRLYIHIQSYIYIYGPGGFLKWGYQYHGVPQNGWFRMENPIKMDDLEVPLLQATSIYIYIYLFWNISTYEMIMRYKPHIYIYISGWWFGTMEFWMTSRKYFWECHHYPTD